MPRLCVMTTIAMPRSRERSFMSFRICAWIVTSSAVVGSSAMMSFGIAREPDRDHHALAHAAGELVRILVEAALGVGDAHHLQELGRALARGGHVHPQVDQQRLHDLEADGEHRVERRHRLLEDHRDVAPANLAHLVVGELQQVAALEEDAAADDAPGGLREEPHDRRATRPICRSPIRRRARRPRPCAPYRKCLRPRARRRGVVTK